ncbi:type II CAAX endopeptidase family protein [Telluribacter sp. SYSU D00476]|uniref:type II CAAX endopeptidase family protein n=1 Tax=Telluribacter sp. SYSU D00476 TaxID=2811430 RepID=UPI001FF48A0D|nr:type II CAAX endopeptidase family protein [Telluribacter sp. SYSU D00476]
MKQLLSYFGLAYAISWLVWLPLYGPALGLTSLPTVPFHHALGGLGPLLAALLITFWYARKRGVAQLLAQCTQLRPVGYLAVALLSPFVLAIIAAVMAYFLNGTAIQLDGLLRTREFPEFNLLSFFVYNLIFFGFGEEVGWRGFALPRLQSRMNALTASIVLTVFWALWHLPLFLYRPGYTSMDVVGAVGWGVSLLTGSILLTWLYNSSRGSVLVCAVFHSTVDIAFTADMADQHIVGYMGFLITLWGIMTVGLLTSRSRARVPAMAADK